ncbi:MAG: YqeG family HAD IIIA-type phosphatase [Coriobacteriia bacterium]|nr:YqeG family HAD IIIA-type phosphatase [Coriobacteriia bacterium]
MAIPTYYLESVLGITPQWLAEKGKRAVVLDLDNTILPRDEDAMAPEIIKWVADLKAAGIGVVMVSNSWFGRVSEASTQLDVDFVDKAIKPLPPAFLLGLWKERTWPWHAVVVGDQFFTDVLGGTLLFMTTIMVKPLTEYDLKHTLLLRHLERLILRERQPLKSL